METFHISNDEIDNLRQLPLGNSSLNTESDIFLYMRGSICYVLKELYPFDRNKFNNRVQTLFSIDSSSDLVPNYFIKPEFLIYSNQGLRYWASRYFEGMNFSAFINNPNVSIEVKKDYLKRIGYMLEHMDYIRRNTTLSDFYVGDLHENNFIVDENGDLFICDIDSIKIAGNKSFVSKYLNPFSLFSKAGTKKYKVDNSDDKIADYIVDRNTDLYCYIVMLMKILFDIKVDRISVQDFYRYLNCLSDMGIDKELIDIFNRIILEGDNINPCHHIDSLTTDAIAKVRRRNM